MTAIAREPLGSLLAEIRTGPFGTALHRAEYVSGGTPVINPEHYRSGSIAADSETTVSPEIAERLAPYRLRRGDLVVARRGEMGRCAVVASGQEGWILGTGSAALRPTDRLDADYLAHFLRSPEARRALTSGSVGSTMANLNQRVLTTLPCPVPPLARQRQVVDSISLHFSRLDAAVASLIHAKTNLANARASVLKAAVEGRLVRPEGLLAREEGRTADSATAMLEALNPGRAPVSAPLYATGALPPGWDWCRVAEVVRSLRYGTSAKCTKEQPGVPVLRMGNVVDGGLDLSDLKYLPLDHPDLAGQLLDAGNILFSRTNSAELVGKTAVYKGSPAPCASASYLIRVAPAACLAGSYLSINLNSAVGRAWVRTVVSQQVGQANVNGTKLGAYVFAIPPLSEQHRIVAEVDRRMSVLDEVERTVEATLARCHRLRQSTLRRAFAGQLAPSGQNEVPSASHLDRAVEPVR